MKRLGGLVLALALLLGLCACGGREEAAFGTDAAGRLIEAGVFSEELEELEGDMVTAYFGLDAADVTQATAFLSPGSTAEEVGVFRFRDAAAARANMPRLEEHLEYLKESNEDYRPLEMPKLGKAILEQRGASLLFLVAADPVKAREVLG